MLQGQYLGLVHKELSTTPDPRAVDIPISQEDLKHGGRRYAPRVFTEQGVAMLSSVLRSRRAVMVNIEIMRVRAMTVRSEPTRKRIGFGT